MQVAMVLLDRGSAWGIVTDEDKVVKFEPTDAEIEEFRKGEERDRPPVIDLTEDRVLDLRKYE